MSQSDVRLGLTNVVKRLAYFYLCKGLGKHTIAHDVYDEVMVSEFDEWKENPADPSEHGAGVRVEFRRQGKRVRWVEFRIRTAGGGGDQAVFLIE
jgi:hypothetical protein